MFCMTLLNEVKLIIDIIKVIDKKCIVFFFVCIFAESDTSWWTFPSIVFVSLWNSKKKIGKPGNSWFKKKNLILKKMLTDQVVDVGLAEGV